MLRLQVVMHVAIRRPNMRSKPKGVGEGRTEMKTDGPRRLAGPRQSSQQGVGSKNPGRNLAPGEVQGYASKETETVLVRRHREQMTGPLPCDPK